MCKHFKHRRIVLSLWNVVKFLSKFTTIFFKYGPFFKTENQYSCLEPKDTIFVKSIKENSPAQQAGLCEGGKTHTQHNTHKKTGR